MADLARLRGMIAGSPSQIEYALRLIESTTQQEALEAALAVVADGRCDEERLHAALITGFTACAEGERSDRGCYLRTTLLQALRGLARRSDTALLARALGTYEFIPPGRSEDAECAGMMRAAALLTINEVDDALAGFHAVRLLVDRFNSVMSGEPAATAARVLAAQRQTLPLYAFALGAHADRSEAVAESLRGLVAAPATLVHPLVERYIAADDEMMVAGLCDLILDRADRADFTAPLLEFLRDTRLYNVFRYVTSAIVAGRRRELIAHLAAQAADEPDRFKAEILREALELR